jgi:hypothetical protein
LSCIVQVQPCRPTTYSSCLQLLQRCKCLRQLACGFLLTVLRDLRANRNHTAVFREINSTIKKMILKQNIRCWGGVLGSSMDWILHIRLGIREWWYREIFPVYTLWPAERQEIFGRCWLRNGCQGPVLGLTPFLTYHQSGILLTAATSTQQWFAQ